MNDRMVNVLLALKGFESGQLFNFEGVAAAENSKLILVQANHKQLIRF